MSPMLTTDHLHAADTPEYVRTPVVTYVAVEGQGAPGTEKFYRKKVLLSHIAGELSPAGTRPVVEIQYWYPEGSAEVGIADFYSVNPIPSPTASWSRYLPAPPRPISMPPAPALRVRPIQRPTR